MTEEFWRPDDNEIEKPGVKASENFDDAIAEGMRFRESFVGSEEIPTAPPEIQPMDYLNASVLIRPHGTSDNIESFYDSMGGTPYARRLYIHEHSPNVQKTKKVIEQNTDNSHETDKTKKNDYAAAAINPGMHYLNDGRYKSAFKITFVSLSSWAAWAEKDPMFTGNMGYVAYCLPGKKDGQSLSCGNVDLSYCRWAKKNESSPHAENRKTYKQDMGESGRAGTEQQCEGAPWLDPSFTLNNHDYQRQCGPVVGGLFMSPAIIGAPFPSVMDSKLKAVNKFSNEMRAARKRMEDAFSNKGFKGLCDLIFFDSHGDKFRSPSAIGLSLSPEPTSRANALAAGKNCLNTFFGHTKHTAICNITGTDASKHDRIKIPIGPKEYQEIGVVRLTAQKGKEDNTPVWESHLEVVKHAQKTLVLIEQEFKIEQHRGGSGTNASAQDQLLQKAREARTEAESVKATALFEARQGSISTRELFAANRKYDQLIATANRYQMQASRAGQGGGGGGRGRVLAFISGQARHLRRAIEYHKDCANNKKTDYMKAQQAYNAALEAAANTLRDATASKISKQALAQIVEDNELTHISTRNKDNPKQIDIVITPQDGPEGYRISGLMGRIWTNEYDVAEAIFQKTKIPGGVGTIGRVKSDIPYTLLRNAVIKNTITDTTPKCSESQDSVRIQNPDAGQLSALGGINNDMLTSWNANGGVGGDTSAFVACGGKDGTNRAGNTNRQNPAPSLLLQDGCGDGDSKHFLANCGGAYSLPTQGLWPSYAPTTNYDPNQQYTNSPGYSNNPHGVSGPVSSGLHGNIVNGNDIRIIENCKIFAGNGTAINTICQASNEKNRGSFPNPTNKPRGFVDRAMTVMLRNNIIVHNFASDAYPTESGLWNNGTGNNVGVNNDADLTSQLLAGPAIAATYVQSTRSLTASGWLGTRMPSWVKRNSTVIFHTNHACSGVEYQIDQRVSSSGLILSSSSNPGSNVGPGVTIEIRPKNYIGPYNQRRLKFRGKHTSITSIKNRATNGGMLEVWMQNNTITAHPDANLPEPQRMLETDYPGSLPHQTVNLWSTNSQFSSVADSDGKTPALSGSIKSFQPKYIAVANISNSVRAPYPDGHYEKQQNGATTGFVQSHLNVNMENNLICPVYNARLPSGKTYVDDYSDSSPKWDVISDIGLPVVNAVSSGCMITHCQVRGNVIVGRSQYDTSKKIYVQHSGDGDNIINAMDQTSNREYPDFVKPGNPGYRTIFASGFRVYNGGPDDVFRSYFGPFYKDNVSDKHLSVTGKDDFMDSFTRQGCGNLQLGLNDGVFFREGVVPTVVQKTFAGLEGPQNTLPQSTPRTDIIGRNIAAQNLRISNHLPKSVLRPKQLNLKTDSSNYELLEDGKGVTSKNVKEKQAGYSLSLIHI